MTDHVTDCDNCDILCDLDHMTPLLSNYEKRKVKDKRNKEIKVIMAKAAHNTNMVKGNQLSTSQTRGRQGRLSIC